MTAPRQTPDLVVIILAAALGIAVVIFAVAIFYEVADHHSISEVPANSSQVLTLIFGGIIAILGNYEGSRSAHRELVSDP
ncbi:MAG: hypothetical protein FWC87_01110 [Acidimicrobiaceae bacterium]|nr:hypothetical protein [Acidimicrobiaceae bacterium]